jgi:uncharacterized membrane protein YGL010W
MKTLAEQMACYTAYHRDGRNRATHFVGVPAIAFSLLIPMAFLRLGVGGIEISLAMLFAATVLIYYLVLDRAIGAALLLFFLPVLWLAEVLVAQYAMLSWIVFAICFVGGWILQLVGHVYEGRRPALVDNFFQVFIAPLFLMAEVFFALGLKRGLHDEVEALYPAHLPDADGQTQASSV